LSILIKNREGGEYIMEKELISIKTHKIGDTEINSVNARDLWLFLESKQRFSDWIKNRIIKYGFAENVDYSYHKIMNASTQQIQMVEYIISIDMAKELAMVENNNKGKQIRRYFIEIENQWRQSRSSFNLPKNYKEALQHLLIQVEENEKLQLEIKEQKPKVEFANSISDTENLTPISNVAKSLCIGPLKLFSFLRDQKVLMDGESKNMPYQKYLNMGWFKVITKYRKLEDGQKERYYQTKVSGKGIEGIFKLWNEYGDQGVLSFN
jgi:anti-repressor protein